MHGSMRDRLEDLLAGKGSAAKDQGLVRHLSSCKECSAELGTMKEQAELLRSWRAPEEIEPAAGFYGRVMQRIEDSKDSVWAVFIYSPFTRRLTYASLAATLLLGSYVISQETRDGDFTVDQAAAVQVHQDPPVAGSLQQQRDAVLVNFVSHQGPAQ
jgi:anti-sigma factor RsiW